MNRPAPRQISRQVALQVLYAVDLNREPAEPAEPGAAFEAVAAHFELPEGARAFAQELVEGVLARREELDAIIAEHARNWRLSRMAAVDRNVLRLATYELVATQTPTSVILDQAIELARRFGDDPSPGFVNGVLDAVAHSARPDDRGSLPPPRESAARPGSASAAGSAAGRPPHTPGDDL